VIPVGPRNTVLSGTFKIADTFAYQDDIGEVIIQIIRQVPHGILCFLPSYNMLEKLQQRWEMTGIWTEFKKEKHVFIGRHLKTGPAELDWPDNGFPSLFNVFTSLVLPSMGSYDCRAARVR
jgi:hypothetical protein